MVKQCQMGHVLATAPGRSLNMALASEHKYG